MLNFTVAICTYNGQERLPLVLEQLRAQVKIEDLTWEVLVIDNNSTDQTAQVVETYQNLLPVPVVYYFEPQQGLAFARQTALEKAQGELVGFLDDDNLPTPNWVEAAVKFAREHPQVGAYGGLVRGDYEVEPPVGFEKIASFLAIVERGSKPFIYNRVMGVLPPGAGLVVRRQVWLSKVPQDLFLKGRIGNLKLASEDLEAISYIQNGGWEVWHNPEMQIYHKIPSYRLERDYLLSIVRGVGLARSHIRFIRLKPWQRPFALIVYLLNDLRRALCYYLQYHQILKTDLAAACMMEFFTSSLLSPFYLCGANLRIATKF